VKTHIKIWPAMLVGRRMKTHIKIWLAVLVGIGLIYLLYQRLAVDQIAGKLDASPSAQKDAASILRFAPDAPQLAYLHIQPVTEIFQPASETLNGRIAYDENYTSRVSSPIAGRTMRVAAQVGDKVRAGQALLWLDSPDFASAVADLRKAEAMLRQKQLAFDRAKTLYDGQVLARKDFEAAEADLKQSEAEMQRAKLRLQNLGSIEVADADAQRFTLRAPISGVVAERQANPGTEVRPDAPNPLFVITDPVHLSVLIDLSEQDLNKIHLGQAVSIEVDAYPETPFSARVANIGQTLDPATRRLQARCAILNRELRLKPEMYARVTLLADEKRKVLRVPNSALLTKGLYSYVFVEKEPGVLEKRQVVLDMQSRDYSIIKQGLQPGERVVTTGALLLNSELSGES